ncbi:hypothetical protein Ssi03_67300 [Sphaerisporangium siamense]|uniref:Anti-sigma regulatory factor (Ser/Thr protein kinase) n=1 Tax=Sphaerisporangium siamense TaxID=795645 RepID=A0A7W7DDS5_9ACTN|nr:ATP-binding protein [Sphaerisporangium siamense]MBB4704761.1 anti-sigma regulatory factor (Ser/Thr protein kinase) [Sphaerisporangium siamense]GII88740.1 hypothetical protein Ssi03_67300 [Sphaerisporangium siamense]
MRTTTFLGFVELLGRTSSVTLARAYVRGLLMAAGHRDTDDVELLAGELVANAVNHSNSGRRTSGTIKLRVSAEDRNVRVEVTDEGSAMPIPPIPAQVDPLQESGRGLWLVRELSSAWGWTQSAAGRTVWFEMASPQRTGSPDSNGDDATER